MESDLVSELILGLTSSPKYFPMWFRYEDPAGFGSINGNEHYYRVTVERELLTKHVHEMIKDVEKPCILMDLGSGCCSVAKPIIDGILQTQASLLYVPVDLDKETMFKGVNMLKGIYGDKLDINPVVGTYQAGLRKISDYNAASVIVWFNSILNEAYEDQVQLMKLAAECSKDSDRVIIALDTTSDPEAIKRAYMSDAQKHLDFGVLRSLGREYGDNKIDLNKFKLVFDFVKQTDVDKTSFTRKKLVSTCKQTIPLPGLNMEWHLEEGEPIYASKWLGSSCKYTVEQFTYIANSGGMRVLQVWQDEEKHAGIFLLKKK